MRRPLRMLGAYPIQQLGVVRQRGDVKFDAIRDPALQLRLAFEQPERQPPRQPRLVADQAQRGFMQEVGAQERAVEVDHERRLARSGGRRAIDTGGNGSHRADESAASVARWAPSRRLSEIDRSSG